MARPRRTIARLHLWLGLWLGGLMVLAGLTGSALIWYVEIDRLLHPEQAVIADHDGPPDYDAALATLRHAYPDKTGPWRFEVTGKPGAIPARYYNPPETAGRDFAPMMVWLAPDGQIVLRRDYWGDYAMTWIYDLHYRLLMGKTGGTLFGWAGLALLALLLSGLWAWWPRGPLAKALRFKRDAARSRRLRDWHKLAGLAGLPLLVMLTLTGVMLALPKESEAVLTPLFGAPQAMPHVHGTPAPAAREITAREAVAAARSALPRARVAWIEAPGAGQPAWRLRVQQPGDPSRRFPHGYVWIGRHDGAVLAVQDPARASGTTTIANWLHPLHDGSAGGLTLRLLATLAGLFPALLFATGWLRWRALRR